MKLKCNFCGYFSKKTDNLWLKQVGNRDYLVCKFHNRVKKEHGKKHKT